MPSGDEFGGVTAPGRGPCSGNDPERHMDGTTLQEASGFAAAVVQHMGR